MNNIRQCKAKANNIRVRFKNSSGDIARITSWENFRKINYDNLMIYYFV